MNRMGFPVVVVVMAILNKFFTILGTEDALFEEKATVGVGLIGKLEVSFHHLLMGTIDVKMVGIGGSDDSHIRMKLKEGAIIFIGLDDHIFTIVIDKEIAIEILADTTEESATSTGGIAQQMGNHGSGSGLTMAAGHCDTLLTTGQFSKHLRTFLHLDTTANECLKF